MKYFKNRKTAIGITCIIVFISILLGARISLIKLSDEALRVFNEGERQNGKGIPYDLDYISEQCYNLTVVAGRYIKPEDVKITEVLSGRDKLVAADTPGDKFEAKEKLLEAAMNLYEILGTMKLDERDQYYRDSFAVDIESRQLIISHNSYNEEALAFNKTLKQFPANILSKLTFVNKLELYE